MSLTDRVKLTILLGIAAFVLLPASQASGQDGPQPWKVIPSGDTGNPADDVTDMVVNENGIVALPNPYPVMITDWQILPPGRSWGAGPAGGFGPDGHYWQMDRCGSDSYLGCLENRVNYVLKFDVNTGQLLQSFGAGEVFSPHAIHFRHGGQYLGHRPGREPGRHDGPPGAQVQPPGTDRDEARDGRGGRNRSRPL